MRKTLTAMTIFALAVPALPSAASAHGRSHYYQGKTWRDSEGRLRCKRPNGTTGLIVRRCRRCADWPRNRHAR